MQDKVQFFLQETANLWDLLGKPGAIITEQHKIICVSEIVFCFQFVLCELVNFIHIYVAEKLRRKIAQRQPNVRPCCIKT